MKILGNTTALLVALSVMGGLMLAQRDYQNSWREPSVMQTSPTVVTNASTPEGAGQYKVVMK
jgi:hypothetical protein